MFRAFGLAIDQLGDQSSRSVLIRAVALTTVLYIVIGVAAWWGIGRLPKFETGWLNTLVDWLSGAGILILLALIFPAVASSFITLFLDEIADAVEQRHYPNDPPGKPLPFWPAMVGSLQFLGVMIVLNLIALPFYLLTIWFPPLSFVIFAGLNGYLLSREYFELVSWRHMPRDAARLLRKANWGRLWLVGAGISLLLSIPLVGLIAPILATAMMVHLYKSMART